MKIFAYGTLKKGGILHQHMGDAKFIKKKLLRGYVLYLAPDETYPLLYYTGEKKDVVVGEIWKISRKTQKILDKHEEGYVLKKLMKAPIMLYYPALDITHVCRKMPLNKHGQYDFNVTKDYYKGFNTKEPLDTAGKKQLSPVAKQPPLIQGPYQDTLGKKKRKESRVDRSAA